MNYKQRNAAVTTVEECVLMRAGLGRQDFFCPEEEPEIPNLKEAVAFFRANMQFPVTVIGDYDADGIDRKSRRDLRYGNPVPRAQTDAERSAAPDSETFLRRLRSVGEDHRRD